MVFFSGKKYYQVTNWRLVNKEAAMKELVLYIHGKGGCAGESEHYNPLFPDCEVVGLDYHTLL